ncbi:dermonecrotic toxin SPH-like isoform X5 [Amblyomma americanum]
MASHSSRSSMKLKTFMDKQNLRSKGSLLVFLLCALPAACASSSNQPRPLFVFGHMANSLNELDSYMEQGGKYADKLLLFYADTKTDDLSGDNVYQAGVSLANNLMQNLWMNVPFEHMLNVIVSIFNLKAKDLLKGALDTFSQAENSSLYLDHVGFDVSGYNFLDDIASTYKELGIDRHRWQGDGTINCLMKIYPSLRMSFVTERRTAENSTRNYVDKAYVWTVDDTGTIRRYLRNDVDGFVTNKPGNVFKVLAEDPFSSSYRLATSDDNPWQRIP